MSASRVDTHGFTGMCQSLAGMSGAPLEKVIDFEASRAIEKAISLTPALNVSKTRAQFEAAKFSAQPASLYAPKSKSGIAHRGKVKLTKNGFLIYSLDNRYPNTLWRAMAARRKASLQKKLKGRGVSKASWLQIGDALGLQIGRVPAYVRSAQPARGPRTDGYGRRTRETNKYYVELENRSQLLINHLGGARILQQAIDGRRRYFETNLRKGVFDSISIAAKRYPGVFVR